MGGAVVTPLWKGRRPGAREVQALRERLERLESDLHGAHCAIGELAAQVRALVDERHATPDEAAAPAPDLTGEPAATNGAPPRADAAATGTPAGPLVGGRRPAASGRAAQGPVSTTDRVYAIIAAADAPVSRKAIAAELGMAAGGLSKHFQRLQADGKIERVGGHTSGGYIPARHVPETGPAGPDHAGSLSPLEQRVVTIVAEHGPVTATWVADQVVKNRREIARLMRDLAVTGVLARTDGDGYAIPAAEAAA